MSLKQFIAGYIECALWAESSDVDGEGTDDRSIGTVATLALETRMKLEMDASKFYVDNMDFLDAANLAGRDYDHLGHDYWLSRNGHGTGFWDRDLGLVGDALHEAAKKTGERNLYIGDDGLIHQLQG